MPGSLILLVYPFWVELSSDITSFCFESNNKE